MRFAKFILLSAFSFIAFSLLMPNSALAQYGSGCEQYGMWAYASGNSCVCMSGYVMDKGVLGNTQCVSGSSVCNKKLGYGSTYNSLSNSCECSYGYVLGTDSIGRTQCISKNQACQNQFGMNARSTYGDSCECARGYGFSDVLGKTQCVSYDSICRDRLGSNSSYDSLRDSCGCRSGYELTQKSFGSGLECKSCSAKYGINSSWSYIDKECSCDDGYTLKDGQCEKKENNVYFRLLDIDSVNNKILVESEHDFQKYILTYGFQCGIWIDSYLNSRIVLGLGTDFSVDYGDRIVLQNHDRTCSILGVEHVFRSSIVPRVTAPTPSPRVVQSANPPVQQVITPVSNTVAAKPTSVPVVEDKPEATSNNRSSAESITWDEFMGTSSSNNTEFPEEESNHNETSTLEDESDRKVNIFKRIWSKIVSLFQ